MSNKPSAKAIAKLNATTLFPEIRKEIEKNPSLFAIRGFFIFNITKKGVPMTEWYLLFQGFDAPAIVTQKRPEIPKAKRDQQPIPVAIFQIEDSDLLNFMSGGLTGSRGIVSGKIKIAGAMELAEELEQLFRKAKGAEKTLAYLEHKRGKSEKARARLSSSQITSSPPSSSPLSENTKPAPAGGASSKVQNLARRYSAMAKQAAGESNYVPHNNIGKLPQTGGSKVAGFSNKFNNPASATSDAKTAAPVSKLPEAVQEQREDESTQQENVEKEIESSLRVADLTNKVKEIDLIEIPLNKEQDKEQEQKKQEQEQMEREQEPVRSIVEVQSDAPVTAAPITAAVVEDPVHEEETVRELKQHDEEPIVKAFEEAKPVERDVVTEEQKKSAAVYEALDRQEPVTDAQTNSGIETREGGKTAEAAKEAQEKKEEEEFKAVSVDA
ncbi:hypothetical protein EDD11_003793 [Mortierella claussenii]|nr:hypothetical protein EDD11_003793 [Mortierella claussenii]